MATPLFVSRQSRVLVAAMQLTLENSEDELKSAVARALDGWTPNRDVTVPWPHVESQSYTHLARRRIFPVWVKRPEGDGWVKDHEWGGGFNEDAQSIFREVKTEMVRLSGLPQWRFSWEQLRNLVKIISLSTPRLNPVIPFAME